jgi:hypothetical protein
MLPLSLRNSSADVQGNYPTIIKLLEINLHLKVAHEIQEQIVFETSLKIKHEWPKHFFVHDSIREG